MKKLLLLFVFCLWANISFSAPAFVRASTTASGSGGVTIAFTSNNAGDLIVVHGEIGGSGPLNAPTDTAGNTYTLITSDTAGGAWVHYMWYAKNINTSAGTNTITMTNSSAGFTRAAAVEYSGIDTSAPLRNSSHTGASSNSLSTGNITTVSGDLVVASFFNNGNSITAAGGYTDRQNWSTSLIEDKITSTTVENPSATSINNTQWTGVGAAFKPNSVTHANTINAGTINNATIN